jgi:hypothetical protein
VKAYKVGKAATLITDDELEAVAAGTRTRSRSTTCAPERSTSSLNILTTLPLTAKLDGRRSL